MKRKIAALPTWEQIQNQPMLLTDYARATGAKVTHRQLQDNGTFSNYGRTWLPTLGTSGRVQTAYYDGQKMCQGESMVNDETVALPFCFDTKSAKHLGSTIIDGKRYLTNRGKLVYYPQPAVEPELEEILEANRGIPVNEEMQLVGEYIRPFHLGQNKRTLGERVEVCYRYHDQNYTRLFDSQTKNHWFACAPVEVFAPEKDILCTKQLMLAAPFAELMSFFEQNSFNEAGQELNINNYPLGNFVSDRVFSDLILSSDFNKPKRESKLAHQQPVFERCALKKQPMILGQLAGFQQERQK